MAGQFHHDGHLQRIAPPPFFVGHGDQLRHISLASLWVISCLPNLCPQLRPFERPCRQCSGGPVTSAPDGCRFCGLWGPVPGGSFPDPCTDPESFGVPGRFNVMPGRDCLSLLLSSLGSCFYRDSVFFFSRLYMSIQEGFLQWFLKKTSFHWLCIRDTCFSGLRENFFFRVCLLRSLSASFLSDFQIFFCFHPFTAFKRLFVLFLTGFV